MQFKLCLNALCIYYILLMFGFGKKNVSVESELDSEQRIWRDIQELNKEKQVLESQRKELSFKLVSKTINLSTFDSEKKALEKSISEIDKKLDALVSQLSKIQKQESKSDNPDSGLRFNVIELKNSLHKKDIEFTELQKKYFELKEYVETMSGLKPNQSVEAPFDFEKQKKLRLYKILLDNYSELINEHEKKTVGQIKSLINSDDLSIQSLVEKIKPENYSYPENFNAAVNNLFEFFKKEFDFVDPEIPINFWLTPNQLLTEKLADDEDLAVIFCSALIALGNPDCFAVISELGSGKTHAFVLMQFKDLFYLLDPIQGQASFDSFVSSTQEEVLQAYSFNNEKVKSILFKFNNETYEQAND